ncbi:MAG: caspase family protein [Planctomycetota bacterium]
MRASRTPAGHPAQTARSILLALSVLLCSTSCSRRDQDPTPARVHPPGAANASAPPTPVASGPRVLALLIGIADYFDNAQFDDLHGPVGDVDLVARVLKDRWSVASDDLRRLVDHAATVQGVVTAIDEHLLRRAKPGDEVFVYYSGHGSRIPDLSKREPGSKDSTLVLADSRVDGRDGSFDLSDDAIYSLLSPLTMRGVHVTLITDSCHSGGVARTGARVRAVVEGHESASSLPDQPFWPHDVPFLDDDARSDRDELTDYVHLSACAADEFAFEYGFPDGTHGVLTWMLADLLANLGSGTTWRDVARRCSARIEWMPNMPPQTPWLEGPDADRAVFGRGGSRNDRRFDVHIGSSDAVTGTIGTLLGVVPGATLRVFDERSRAVGDVEVTQASFDDFVGHWIAPPDNLVPGVALCAELASQPVDLPRLQVAAGTPGLVDEVGTRAWAVVGTAKPEAEYVLTAEGGRAELRTSDGIPLWRHLHQGSAETRFPLEDFDAACRRETRFRALWGLANPDRCGELRHLSLRFVSPTPDELRRRDADRSYTEASIRPRGGARGGGPPAPEFEATLPVFGAAVTADPLAVLEVVNENLETLYLHVLSLNEAREISVLFPDPGVRDRPATDDAPTKRIRIAVGALSRAEFPPDRPMRERYLVIATRSPLTELHTLEQRIEPSERGSGRASCPAPLEPIFGGGMLRRGGSCEQDLEGVGFAWLDLWVTRESVTRR